MELITILPDRVKQLRISATFIIEHLKWLAQQGILLPEEPLPDDARVVGTQIDTQFNVVSILVHSARFEEVRDGCQIPPINPQIKEGPNYPRGT